MNKPSTNLDDAMSHVHQHNGDHTVMATRADAPALRWLNAKQHASLVMVVNPTKECSYAACWCAALLSTQKPNQHIAVHHAMPPASLSNHVPSCCVIGSQLKTPAVSVQDEIIVTCYMSNDLATYELGGACVASSVLTSTMLLPYIEKHNSVCLLRFP